LPVENALDGGVSNVLGHSPYYAGGESSMRCPCSYPHSTNTVSQHSNLRCWSGWIHCISVQDFAGPRFELQTSCTRGLLIKYWKFLYAFAVHLEFWFEAIFQKKLSFLRFIHNCTYSNLIGISNPMLARGGETKPKIAIETKPDSLF